MLIKLFWIKTKQAIELLSC